jgi:hypothetical protein
MFNILKQGIMKKVLIRTMFAAAGLLFSAGLFAQSSVVPGWSDGVGGDNYESTGTTYMIENATIPLYAQPDPYYHPSYDPEVANTLTAGFTWDWADAGATGNVSFSINGVDDNYTEVTITTAGTYTLEVAESSAMCADATPEQITVEVVAAPSIAFNGTSVTTEDCEGGTFPAAIEATISDGYQAYRLAWTLQITTLDGVGATEFYYTDETGAGQSVPAIYAVNNTQASPEAVANNAADHDITTVGSFAVINNGSSDATTVYTYTLNGLNDQASRWSDFLTLAAGPGVNGAAADAFTYYDTGAETITITVHPVPTTGPIYHIDSGWAN